MPEISNSRRDIPNYSELESQGPAGNLAAAQQSSRRELILLSLTMLFVLGGVGLFTWYGVKLTNQIDRYFSSSTRANFGYTSSARAQ
jgi:flagellar biogenesis protein FliO